jgi:hypothetical protein
MEAITATHSEMAPGMDNEMLRAMAREIESANPLWIVVFGIYSGQFAAFPRFAAPKGAVISARYPGAMRERMRQIERASHIARDEKRNTAAQAATADDGDG